MKVIKFLLLILLNIPICGFSQTDIKKPDGWFNQISDSGEFNLQNLKFALGKDGARRIKNLDKYKDYTMVISASKYDPKLYSGVIPTINFLLIKNKLNWVIVDFQKTNDMLLSQLESDH